MTARRPGPGELLAYALLGMLFGIVLVRGEVLSWYRIQEMFRFQGFHMYGVLLSAIATAVLTLAVLRRSRMRALTGDDIVVPPKVMGSGRRYVLGGITFGVGWVFTGACPGPLFALAGSGYTVLLVAIAAALSGTLAYGVLRPRLPH